MKMRNKLMAASLMLVVSILMMSTASFAWFTISTAPEVSGMKAQAVVNDNFEIALSGTDTTVPGAPAEKQSGLVQTSWGNLIDLTSDDIKEKYNALDKTLRPATLNEEATGFVYPEYGADGRIDGEIDAQLTLVPATTGTTNQFGTIQDGKNNVYGYYMDIWLRTNVGGTGANISLSADAQNRIDTNETATAGKGSYFKITGNDTAVVANQMFADNVQVAWSLLGSAALTYTTNGATTTNEYNYTPVATPKITNFTKTQDATDKDMYKLNGEVIKDAVANTAYLVRVYVYLDGKNITNAGASITDVELQGDLNLQFVHSKTLDAMPMPNEVTSPAA